MNRPSPLDLASLPATVPDAVVRGAELRASGVSGSAIALRCRPGGPWQRVLPGVVLLSNSAPTRRQLLRAALAYAGDGAVITGIDATQLAVDLGPPPNYVHLLVPAGRRITSTGHALIERTTRMPDVVWRDGMPCASVPRAVLDAARRERDASRLRALLSEPGRRGLCGLNELRAELDAGSQRGSAGPRAALRAVSDGILSLAEGRARRIVRSCPIPPPRWNVPVRDNTGALLGVVDAWWDDVALAWDVGTQDFRFGADAARPQQHRLAGSGVVVLRTMPTRLHLDPHGVRRDLAQAFNRAARRIRPSVRGLREPEPAHLPGMTPYQYSAGNLPSISRT
ncbi:MAG: hypothetical protein JOZ47_03835 [Kutzneria sp.]|nr:hypothetical protein [Kutzneria sp.]MBV9844192.1 hypothetical protein [Kutzneria sp.]